jgi:hypothetical protein
MSKMNLSEFDKELWEILKCNLKKAFKKLYKDDWELFDVNIYERTLVARFADYLQKNLDADENFPGGYKVDVEYNRNRTNPKEVNGNKRYPDLIVHKRCSDDNILIVEFKKNFSISNCSEKTKCDSIKLVELTFKTFKYKFGLYAEFIEPANGFRSNGISSDELEKCFVEWFPK